MLTLNMNTYEPGNIWNIEMIYLKLKKNINIYFEYWLLPQSMFLLSENGDSE